MSRTIPSFAEEGLKRFLHGMDRRITDLERGGDWRFDTDTDDDNASVAIRNAAQLLCMAAAGDSAASGGDFVAFSSIVAQHGFAGVAGASGTWTHPVGGVYVLTYEHAWTTYDGGGRILLEVDGVFVGEGVIADGDSGAAGSGTITYRAAEGAAGRIYVEQDSGSAQTFDAVVRVAIPDPTPISTSFDWEQVFVGDVYDLTFDGTNWWTTDGVSTVTKRDANFVSLSTFGSLNTWSRGITFDGSLLWVCGEHGGQEVMAKYNTAGAWQGTVVTGPSTDGNVGIAADGTDLWLSVGRSGAAYVERWSNAGVELSAVNLGSDNHQGVAYFGDRLYVVNIDADELTVLDLSGNILSTIPLAAVVAAPTGVFVADDGTIYVSKDGDGVYRRSVTIGGI